MSSGKGNEIAWIRKESPTPGDVHTDSAGIGDKKRKKPKADGIVTMKAEWSIPVEITKLDEDKCLVFGWASIVEKDGSQVVDLQGDTIDIEDLEDAVYAYALDSRDAGEMHERTTGVGKLVESMVMTVEKQKAIGLPEGSTPLGWWVGYKISPDVFAKVKDGTYPMFSIGGAALRFEE